MMYMQGLFLVNKCHLWLKSGSHFLLICSFRNFSTPWKFATVGEGHLVKVVASVHMIMIKMHGICLQPVECLWPLNTV